MSEQKLDLDDAENDIINSMSSDDRQTAKEYERGCRALQALLAELREARRSPWIPVDERMPEPQVAVLVRGLCWNTIEVAVLAVDESGVNDRWEVSSASDQDTEYFLSDISHWMPLPAAPEVST